jgi:energy-coupling factor transporter transmembrane protein EcfT
MFKPNPMTQLLAFFILAIVVNLLPIKYILLIFFILLAIIARNKPYNFLRSVKRFKWFFLVMVVIFAFNTPGEHIAAWPLDLSPTYEGVKAGLTQLLRVMVMLAGLSLILTLNTRQQLISGFYFLFSPLKFFGVKVERFAARLWLTLHYVEQQQEKNAIKDMMTALKNMTVANDTHENISIMFEAPIFKLVDYIIVLLAIILIGFSIIKGFS